MMLFAFTSLSHYRSTAAYHPRAELYLVVGIWDDDGKSGVMYNEFGIHFKEAGERVKSRVRMNNFDSSGAC